MAAVRKLTLVTSDGERFELEEAVAQQSKVLANMIEDDCADDGIPLPNIAGNHMAKVIEYARKHAKAEDGEEELKAWDKEFATNLDQSMLYHLILASNYLNIEPLLVLLCQTVADMIKGKKPEQIRQIFNIKNDFTPEEEEGIRRENQWAFED